MGLLALRRRAHAREGQSALPTTALRRIASSEALAQAVPAGSRGPARVPVPSGGERGTGGSGVSPHRGAWSLNARRGTQTDLNRAIVQQHQWLRGNLCPVPKGHSVMRGAQPVRSAGVVPSSSAGKTRPKPLGNGRESLERRREPQRGVGFHAVWHRPNGSPGTNGLTPPASRPCADRRGCGRPRLHP
jgi:hypothetical protein